MTSSGVRRKAEGRVRVLGLDPSLSAFGISRLEMTPGGKRFTYETSVLKTKLKGVSRLRWFFMQMLEELAASRPDIVVLEGYAYGVARGNSAISMGELGGVIRLALEEAGHGPVVVPPAKLKKFITGKGNAQKDIVLLEIYKRFKVDTKTSDEADATGLALMAAVGAYDLQVDLPKANLEALRDIEWPVSREDEPSDGV